MSEISNTSLNKVVKGTMKALVGISLGLLLGFAGRLIVARYGTESDYGVFSLALVVLSILVIVASLGLPSGATRYIAYFRGKNEAERVKGTIATSIQYTSLASIGLCLILFFASPAIAVGIFHNPDLTLPLRIFAIGLPFFTIINLLVSIFLGFDRVEAKVYFSDILRNLLFPLLLLPIILFGLPFTGVFYAYLASLILCWIPLMVYTLKRLPTPLTIVRKVSAGSVNKELLFFSLPLLGVTMLQMILVWTDTLMLGYFKTLDIVGLYNAANPLAHLLSTPLGAMAVIYAPITVGLHAQNLVSEIRRNYTILTKWVFSAILPLALIFTLFPELVLGFLFGASYVAASQALRILSIGVLIGVLLGPNGTTLVAIGRARFLMWATMAAAGMNIVLNAALIPQWGITGAAIATAISAVSCCIIRHIKVHRLLKVNPLTKNLLKPAIISTGLILIITFITKSFVEVTLWMLPLLLILFYGLYFLVVLFSKSFNQEDIMMLATIEKRIGIDVTLIKKILRRFL